MSGVGVAQNVRVWGGAGERGAVCGEKHRCGEKRQVWRAE